VQLIKRALYLILVSGFLVACGGERGGRQVDLSGSVTLYESASPRPDFAEACSGQGDYTFIRGGARIEITSGDVVSHEGQLASGRGGEYEECDFPFSGTLILAGAYTVEITANNESVSTTCSSDQVAIHTRGTLGDIAFFNVRITDTGMECYIPLHLR
jgi:hypothetical protein